MRSITAQALRRRAEQMREDARYVPDPSFWKIAQLRLNLVEQHAADLDKFASVVENLEAEIEFLTSELESFADKERKVG